MKTLLEVLLYIRKHGPDNREDGICGIIYSLMPDTRDYFTAKDAFLETACGWDKHSGVLGYPIPSTRPGVSADQMFHNTGNKWDVEKEYGRLRWKLVNFLIERLS